MTCLRSDKGVPSYPVIVVPGITATYLRDQYSLPPEDIWTVLTKDYRRAALHPDDLRFETQEPARVVSDQVYGIAYRELIEELRYNLRQKEDLPVPVFPFGYDWRQPLELLEEMLAAFIDEVIARTLLLRHYHDAGYDADAKVNLVGHSMGGLIIAGYLSRYGGGKIGKVVTLATPFQGSFEAVVKLATGTANLGTEAPSSREREAARLTPALYSLLPGLGEDIAFPPGVPRDLFLPDPWPPQIIQTLAEHIRLRGLHPENASEQAEQLFGLLLATARHQRERVNALNLGAVHFSPRNWLAVIGTHTTTRVRLRMALRNGKPDFVFSSADRQDLWTSENPDEQRLTGDGTVPFDGAVPLFLPYESLVCVTPDDFGYWEIEDQKLAAAAGFHGILPNMDMLHRMIVLFLTGQEDKHGNVWGRRPPGVEKWSPPLPLTEK